MRQRVDAAGSAVQLAARVRSMRRTHRTARARELCTHWRPHPAASSSIRCFRINQLRLGRGHLSSFAASVKPRGCSPESPRVSDPLPGSLEHRVRHDKQCRVDQTGDDSVHADVVARELQSRRLHQADDSPLGRRVARPAFLPSRPCIELVTMMRPPARAAPVATATLPRTSRVCLSPVIVVTPCYTPAHPSRKIAGDAARRLSPASSP